MPNYFVTNTARFNPFTYQELYKTAADITQQHYALEEALANIDDGTLSTYLAGEDRESPYIKEYNDLNSRTQALSEQLAANGVSPNLMRDAIRLKNDYKKFAVPIEAAGKRKFADVAAYNRMYASDPSLIGDNPNEISLDRYISNPAFSANYTSGDKLMAKGMMLGKEFASDFTPTMTPIMGGKYYQMQSKQTATLQDIQTNPKYRSGIDNLMLESGFDPEATDPYTKRVRSALEMGVYSSMQDPGIDYKANPGYKTSSTTVPTDQTPKGWQEIPGKEGLYKIGGTENQRVVIKMSEDGTVSYVTDEEEKGSIIKSVMGDKPSSKKEDKLSGFTGMFTPSGKPEGGFVYKEAQNWIDKDISTQHRKKPIITIFDDTTAREEFSNLKDTKGKYEPGYYYGIREAGNMKSYIKINKSQYDRLKANFGDKFNDMSNSKSSGSVSTEKVESKPQKDEGNYPTVPPGIPAPARK